MTDIETVLTHKDLTIDACIDAARRIWRDGSHADRDAMIAATGWTTEDIAAATTAQIRASRRRIREERARSGLELSGVNTTPEERFGS